MRGDQDCCDVEASETLHLHPCHIYPYSVGTQGKDCNRITGKANNYLAVWHGSCHHPALRVSTTSHSNKGAEKVQHQATNSCAVVSRWQNKFELLFTSFVSSNVSKVCSLSGGKEVHACSLSLASWAECAGTAQRAAVQRHAINLQHLSRWAGGSRKQEHCVQHQCADPQHNWEILRVLVLLWVTWRAHGAPFRQNMRHCI